jgi:hypothetical protein
MILSRHDFVDSSVSRRGRKMSVRKIRRTAKAVTKRYLTEKSENASRHPGAGEFDSSGAAF